MSDWTDYNNTGSEIWGESENPFSQRFLPAYLRESNKKSVQHTIPMEENPKILTKSVARIQMLQTSIPVIKIGQIIAYSYIVRVFSSSTRNFIGLYIVPYFYRRVWSPGTTRVIRQYIHGKTDENHVLFSKFVA